MAKKKLPKEPEKVFKIVYAAEEEEMEAAVTAMLNEGYSLYGPLQVHHHYDKAQYTDRPLSIAGLSEDELIRVETQYTQAMTKGV